MKVFCKRTYFDKNLNFFKVSGADYGETYVKWKKGNFYEVKSPHPYERSIGIYYIIQSENMIIWTPLKFKEFKKYFIDIDEIRNNKINQIII